MYQVLYRKWRPQTFSDVYGQPAITTALKNELRTGPACPRLSIYRFAGTGKTSCAKILSKAVKCLSPRKAIPCNECEICRGIDDGVIMDVVEIDAASNNGVDSIRDLREEVNFTPVGRQIPGVYHRRGAYAFRRRLQRPAENPGGTAPHVIFFWRPPRCISCPPPSFPAVSGSISAALRRRISPPASLISRIRKNSPSPMTRPC